MKNKLQQLVADRLEELKLGPVEAATKAGLERTYIRDIIEGRKQSIRSDKIAQLARALQIDESALGGATTQPTARMVRVKGYVQAGHWAETWELPQDDQYEVPVPVDAALRPYTLYAAETRGPSMDRRYPEGTVLVFTHAIETHEQIKVGKRYIIERERADGMREATVKTLWRDDSGVLWLLPESNDPRFQEPIPLDGHPDDTIRIVGQVRYAVSRE